MKERETMTETLYIVDVATHSDWYREPIMKSNTRPTSG